MSKKKQASAKSTPACPVRGCKAQTPHIADDVVKSLVNHFKGPDKLLGWVHDCLCQIHDSIQDDYLNHRLFAWTTRLRQVEELYFRTLYLLFLVPDDAVPHVLSGDLPNSLTSIYKEVNATILHGRGILTDPQNPQTLGHDTGMEFLHSGGHVDYKAMQTVAVFKQANHTPQIDRYMAHLRLYIERVDYMRKMFLAGREKKTVQQLITKLHQP